MSEWGNTTGERHLQRIGVKRMLGTSDTIRRELPLSHRAAKHAPRDYERSGERGLRKAKQNKLNYRKRKVTGLCSYGHCPDKTEPGHTHCRKHLQSMSERASKRRNERIAQGLCTSCGERPQFWGRKCIICRQVVARDPLPSGAKRALRLHREAETRRQQERIQRDAREAAVKLLASKQVHGKWAEALRLYAGIDNGKWRTYEEVGKVMNITKERVRQLLLPSKLILSSTLSDCVPWRPVERGKQNGKCGVSPPPMLVCKHSNDAGSRILNDGSYLYEECGLPNVFLFGLTVDHGQGCESEIVSIPCVDDLHRKLARAILLKPAALTGRELRFLRSTAGLTPLALAEELGVAFLTVLAWEEFYVLRRPNDLAARMVIASVISPDEAGRQMLKMVRSIGARKSEVARVNAYWINEKAQWLVTLQVNCD